MTPHPPRTSSATPAATPYPPRTSHTVLRYGDWDLGWLGTDATAALRATRTQRHRRWRNWWLRRTR